MINIPWYLRMTIDTSLFFVPMLLMYKFPGFYYEIVRNKRMLAR